MGLGIAWLKAHCFGVFGNCLVYPAQVAESRSKIIMRARIIWLQADCCRELHSGFVRFSLEQVANAERIMRFWEIRFNSERLGQMAGRRVQPGRPATLRQSVT